MTDISELDVPIFRRLSPEKLAEMSAGLERRYLAAGQVLFNQGDAGDELYIIQEGCVAIFTPSIDRPGQEKPLRLFKAGDLLGEMALIDCQPRSLSARTLEPTRLLVLRGDSFRRLVRDDPAVAVAVMSGLSDRIRYTTEFLNQVRHWVGRMSAGKYKTEQFIQEMQDWVQRVACGDPASPRPVGTGQAGRQAGGQLDAPAGTVIGYRDEMLATLAAEFAQMATQVREREEALRRQVEQLRIEIDEAKKQRQVNEIVESEYFQSLKSKAASLRQKRE
ncbi:MAG: cyclic nucleotide-binding domain-containing protein [Anaerolineae bacterium]|nr:cyclic nucleotide-binding domain-containing protein [Anaerolineae bacterium]